jgi:iron complex outermembrane recepter protein
MKYRNNAVAVTSGMRARHFAGAASAIALSFALSGTAFAQAAAPAAAAEPEVVIVTGIRAALQNAINTKKNLQVISETVSAEDIGKLPDVSIAESIARLPGLAAERIDGRAQRISIRGLGPDFTTSLLNGREQVSTNDGRGIEFDQYPSELLSSVNVYKTTQAGLAAQGIAGTVDLRTVRPLAYGRRAAVITGRYQYKTLGQVLPDVEPNGYRLTGSYIDQFMDGKLGVAIGVAHMYDPSGTQRTEAYDTGTTNAVVADPNGQRGYLRNAAGVYLLDSNGNKIRETLGNAFKTPGGFKVNASTTAITRTGVMGVLEYKPTDNLSMSLDAYYSTFLSEQNNRGVEVNLGQGANNGWVRNSIQTTNGYATSGTFFGRYAIRNIYNENDATVKAIGFHTDYNFSTATKLGFDFGYSAAQRDTIFFETQPCFLGSDIVDTGQLPSGPACNQSKIGYSLNSNGALSLSIADNLADPAKIVIADPYGWGAQGFLKRPAVNDELKTYRFDISHEFSGDVGIKSIEFGVNYADRRKERTYRQQFLRNSNALAPLPASLIAGTVNLGFGGLGNAIVFDPLTALATGALKDDPSIAGEWWQGTNNWNVSEKITTVFFKANIDTQFAGVPVTGNFGVQYINSDQSSDGFFAAYFLSNNGGSGGVRPVSAGIDYGEVLPSLNLSFEAADDLFVRVGLGRVLSRPNMADMRITREINFDASKINSLDPYNSPYTGDGGNPFLRPTISNNADLAVEKYFGRKGVVSLAVFQKNLETYLRPGGDRFFLDLSGYPSPSWITDAAGNVIKPKIQTAYVTTPGNAKGGELKGIEFALSLPGELFTEALDGYGVYFNVSQNYSSVEFADSRAGKTELPGFSKTTGNLALYYEKHGFQARISGRYRSSYLQDIVAFDANIERRVSEPETIIDAQIGYEFPASSPLNGLSVVLQGSNITDEPWQNYYPNPKRTLNYDVYGATYQLGVTYKF